MSVLAELWEAVKSTSLESILHNSCIFGFVALITLLELATKARNCDNISPGQREAADLQDKATLERRPKAAQEKRVGKLD